jgi:hypothetical protein
MADQFIFEHAPASWHEPLWLALALIVAVLVWQRYGPSPAGWRGRLLKTLRSSSALLLISLLAAPAWLGRHELVHTGRLAVAVDTSASMARTDHRGHQPRIQAAQELAKAIAASNLNKQATMSWWEIGDQLRRSPADQDWDPSRANQGASRLGNQLLELASKHHPQVIVLLSDGRHTAGLSLDASATTLAEQGVRVFTLSIGSAEIEPELRLSDVVLPSDLPRGERQPVIIHWSHRGLSDSSTVQWRITDQNGQLLAEADEIVVVDQHPEREQEQRSEGGIVLDEPGQHELTVHLQQGDLSMSRRLSVLVHDRRLQVLLLAGRPRWELRYLRAALDRDQTVDLHSYLLSGTWQRWGDERHGPQILRLDTAQAGDYDAIIIGDIPAAGLGPAAETAIDSAVRERGSALIWLPGERGHLAGFSDRPLGRLLPARLPGRDQITDGYRSDAAIRVARSEAAQKLGLLICPSGGWHDRPPLAGACPLSDIRAGSQILLEDDSGRPLIVTRAYGAGRALLIGIDDTWRWRRQAGDRFLHAMHSSLLRWASGGRLHADKPWRLSANPRQPVTGETLGLALAPAGALDDSIALPDRVTVRLLHENGEERIVALPRRGENALFASSIPAPSAGSWEVILASGLAPEQVSELHLDISMPDTERRDPRADPAAMASLAERTGGSSSHDANSLIDQLPDLRRREMIEQRRRWWDAWLPLTLLLLTLCLEWSLRRRWRMP